MDEAIYQAGSSQLRLDVLVAIELSGTSWLVGVLMPGSERVSRYQVKSGDGKALLHLLETVRSRATAASGRPAHIASCYEAGFDGFWLHRLLDANGVTNHVIDRASIRLIENLGAPRPMASMWRRWSAH